MASSVTNMTKPISIVTALLSLLLLALLASPASADSPNNHRDVTKGRRSYRSLVQRRGPVDWRIRPRGSLETPSWALGAFPGDWESSEGVESPLGWEYAGCDTKSLTDSSPNYEDAITAAANLRSRGNETCVPKEGFGGHHCALITAYRSVNVYFCGNPGIDIKCSQVSDIILGFGGQCATFLHGAFRERGTVALFPGGWPLDYTRLSFAVIDGPGLYTDI